ncbi:MAG: right-handed parallel beta-helix repeat-containing protein, partial [Verrucomicrobiota bacterium]
MIKHLLTLLTLLALCAAHRAHALPGEGPPLTETTGTVYNVHDVASLSSALSAANAAGVPATILLADNTYQLGGFILAIRSPGLIVRSQSGNRDAVVLRGPDEGPGATQAHIFLVEADNVTIADVTLGYCRNHGVQIRGEAPWDVAGTRIHNCRIVNCNEQFIKGSGGAGETIGATDGLIQHCLFEFTSGWAYQFYTGGIDIHRGVNWIVRDNLFRHIRNPTALPNIAEHAIHFWNRAGVPQNITVERNWIINCDRGIGFGLSSFDGGFQGGSSVIRNNMVVNDGAGGHTDVGLGLEHANDVRVENNTVYIPTYWAPIEYRFTSTSNILFRNNLVNSPIQLRNNAPPAAFSNNIDAVQTNWFADIPNGDLRLTPAAAPAINGGVPLPHLEDDLCGGFRPALGRWDVGADEFEPGWASKSFPDPVAFAAGKTPTHEIHVATTGSNPTGDGSAGNPYATIEHAAGFATPGCAIVVAPGVYPGGNFINDLTGTAAQPIWIRGADPTNRPVINGSSEGIHLTRVRYLIVEHLEIQGNTSNGLNCDDGGDYGNPTATQFVLFRNLYFHDIGAGGNQDCLKLSGVNDYAVLDSVFLRGSAGGSGVDHVGCHRGVIAGCSFTDMGS